MRLDIDRVIQTGVGVSLSCLSVSGIMCINRGSCPTARPEACPTAGSGSCPKSESGSCHKYGSCLEARINLNFGLGAMGLTGLLLVYKSVRM